MHSTTELIPASIRLPRQHEWAEQSARWVEPLTLLSATYDPADASVTIRFDQEINPDGMELNAVTVVDGRFTGQAYVGSTTTRWTATSVTIELVSIGPVSAGRVLLNVDAENGILALSDEAEWEGVTGLALPFV